MRRRYKKKFWFNPNRPEQTLDPQYKQWRTAVYKRDKYQCRWPGCKCKRRLSAHHIQKWSSNPFLRYDVNNGVTLCWAHHKQVTGAEETYAPLLITIVGTT